MIHTFIRAYIQSLTFRSKVLLGSCLVLGMGWGLTGLGLAHGLPFHNTSVACPAPNQRMLDDPIFEGDAPRSLADLQQFCMEIHQLFHTTNLTRGEAITLYTLFQARRNRASTAVSQEEQLLQFINDYYPVGPQLFEDRRFRIPQRVMITKRSAHVYALFYYTIACGVTYRYQEVAITGQTITRVVTLATWTTSSAC